MLSPKTLKYLRLTHRYVSFICAGILFVYLLSGFLLNHRKEFTFMNQKKERTVDYIFQLPANKDDFTGKRCTKDYLRSLMQSRPV